MRSPFPSVNSDDTRMDRLPLEERKSEGEKSHEERAITQLLSDLRDILHRSP